MRERGREVRGVSGASRRTQEVARGKEEVAEASRARATPRLCLLAEEDDRGGVEMGWAVLGQVSGRQVSPGKFLFFYFCSVLFC